MPENWYFTFGLGQNEGATKNCYVKIFGTVESSRDEMIRRYGKNWSMQYSETEFLPQIQKYGLQKIE